MKSVHDVMLSVSQDPEREIGNSEGFYFENLLKGLFSVDSKTKSHDGRYYRAHLEMTGKEH